jgi:hypothetical protein
LLELFPPQIVSAQTLEHVHFLCTDAQLDILSDFLTKTVISYFSKDEKKENPRVYRSNWLPYPSGPDNSLFKIVSSQVITEK